MSDSEPRRGTERTSPPSKGLVSHVRDTGHELVHRFAPAPVEAAEGSAPSGAVGTAPSSRGIEPPREIAATIALVDRAFAFVDLCGFTRFIATNGEHAAIDALSRFRQLTREIAVRRGVLVAKWLGDGAMIVGVEVGPTLATAVELIGRYDGSTLALRGGFAHGQALIMDGDDYIGRPTNFGSTIVSSGTARRAPRRRLRRRDPPAVDPGPRHPGHHVARIGAHPNGAKSRSCPRPRASRPLTTAAHDGVSP